jgi:hypothetical protein
MIKKTKEKPKQIVKWFTPKELSAVLGIAEDRLNQMRLRRLGPRYKKLGPTRQAHVMYAEPDVVEWQARQVTVETN